MMMKSLMKEVSHFIKNSLYSIICTSKLLFASFLQIIIDVIKKTKLSTSRALIKAFHPITSKIKRIIKNSIEFNFNGSKRDNF